MNGLTFETSIPLLGIAARLGAACLCGFLVGFEREARDRPAGLRTHMLTALAAALFGIIAIEMIAVFDTDDDSTQLDPIRVVEAVTAGVAFLAAGTIIQSRGNVRGLTTGAGMWLAGAIGLACGTGLLTIALIATVLAVIILAPLRMIESHIFDKSPPDYENLDE
ncbi:MAG: MgtC/SapB family protein [Henriciella sp.]|uniref:MgtC/SapB family protein n=1 Tax=Henriciella sp. TaxID=1968823 RepID=UPI003C73674E